MSMSCECSEGGPEFMATLEPTARKVHRCCECSKSIEPGETYERVSGLWDGEFSTFKTCERCSDLRLSLEASGFCVEFGALLSDHREYLEEFKPPRLESLSTGDRE